MSDAIYLAFYRDADYVGLFEAEDHGGLHITDYVISNYEDLMCACDAAITAIEALGCTGELCFAAIDNPNPEKAIQLDGVDPIRFRTAEEFWAKNHQLIFKREEE